MTVLEYLSKQNIYVSGELPTTIKEDTLKCWNSIPHDIKERLAKMYNNEEEKWTH